MINIRELLGPTTKKRMWCLVCPACESHELYTTEKPKGYLTQGSTFLPNGRRLWAGEVRCRSCGSLLDTSFGHWKKPTLHVEEALKILSTLELSGREISNAELDIALASKGL